MTILRERLEKTRQLIEETQNDGFQTIKPDVFHEALRRTNIRYAERLLNRLKDQGLVNFQADQMLANSGKYISEFDRSLEPEDKQSRMDNTVKESYNRIYELLKTFMDKFSLEDQADEQEKERAAKYDNKERQRAMCYRLLTTFLVGIVFMALAYSADMAGLQFVFLHKKPSCPESYVCIKQEDHDKQQKELEELTNRVATYAVPAAKLANPIPSELKPRPDVIQSTKSIPKQKE